MDLDVFQKAKAGDQVSISLLIQNYDPTMEKFASRLCATTEDAKDSVQHARYVIFKKLGHFNELAKMTTWLFAVIKNECYRLQKKMFGFSLHGPSEFSSEVDVTMEEKIERNLLLKRISSCIAKMDKDDAEILLLKDVEGHELEEISNQLNLSLPATKSRLHRSRTKLKDLLSLS